MLRVSRRLEIQMPRPYVVIFASLFALSLHSVSVAESPVRICAGEKLRKQNGSTNVQLVHHQPSTQTGKQLLAVTFSFDKDVRIARNELPAGEYEVAHSERLKPVLASSGFP